MEVIAGFSTRTRFPVTGYLLALALVITQFVPSLTNDEITLNEEDKRRVLELVDESTSRGGDLFQSYRSELEKLRQPSCNTISKNTYNLINHLRPDKNDYERRSGHDHDHELNTDHDVVYADGDDDNQDAHWSKDATGEPVHDAMNEPANGTEATSTISNTIPAEQQQTGHHANDDGNCDDDCHEPNANHDEEHDQQKAETTARVSSSSDGPLDSSNQMVFESAGVDPITGDKVHETVVQSLPASPGDPRFVSVTKSTVSADGTRKSKSRLSQSSSFYSSSSTAGSNQPSTSHESPEHHQILSDSHGLQAEAHEEHAPPAGDDHLLDDTDDLQSNDGHPVEHQTAHFEPERQHTDEQDGMPSDEDIEETYIDDSDPSDRKKVHIKKLSKTQIRPDGVSHQKVESKTSTSLGDNPNSFHRSSSSYSSSSSSNFTKQPNKHRKRPKSHHKNRYRLKNEARQMLPKPLMSLQPLAVIPQGVHGYMPPLTIVDSHVNPLRYGLRHGLGAPTKVRQKSGNRNNFYLIGPVSKRQAKKLNKMFNQGPSG